MTDDIYETPSTTPNFQTELAAQLAELIPEAIADGKVDVEKLKELLDGDAADGSERFGLFWPGKKGALRAAQEPTTATLKPDIENSKDWDTTKNIFIEGDNLEVLKILQKYFHAKVKMIYIDPPYNTGKDFVYPDNYKEGLDTYLEWTRQVNEEGKKVSTNAETEGRYHSNWLNMMYPRLKLARNLLTDDGVIFISIDDHEQDNLKKLCNEVFGEGNFIATIANTNNPKGRSDDKFIATAHEYLIVYAKKSETLILGGFEAEENIVKRYNKVDSSGRRYREIDLRKTGDSDRREDRPNMHYFFFYSEENNELRVSSHDRVGKNEIKIAPMKDDGTDGRWRWGFETTSARINDLIARFMPNRGIWGVFEKDYLDTRSLVKPTSSWTFKDVNSERGSEQFNELGFQKEIFPRPKPVGTIERTLRIGGRSNQSDIVLDFFAGSATTAHAVMQLNAEDNGNRKFIMVQLPEPTPENSEAQKSGFKTIADISRKRIKLAGEKIKADNPLTTTELDTGFRAYKLVDTNFAKWRVSSDVDSDALQQHLLELRESSSADEATSDDLLTEILLKQGYSLTEKITPVEIAGLELRAVGDNIVLAYLNEHIKPTLEQLRAVVDEKPARLIVLEDAFQGDDELKTNLAQLAKSKGIELWTA